VRIGAHGNGQPGSSEFCILSARLVRKQVATSSARFDMNLFIPPALFISTRRKFDLNGRYSSGISVGPLLNTHAHMVDQFSEFTIKIAVEVVLSYTKKRILNSDAK